MFIGYEMYRAYELKNLFFEDDYDFQKLRDSGLKQYEKVKNQIKTNIKSFILTNGHLDGTQMQNNWFPQIDADVFISHSHNDEPLAIAFSQWLNEKFGIKAFVDSCIWGNANDLLKKIDTDYCRPDKINKPNSYSYELRNYSTSHIQMMLSTALSMMIDKTECIIFLNTPNSVVDGVFSITKSPWIYSEIVMTKLIRQRPISDYRNRAAMESLNEDYKCFSAKAKLTIEYALSKEHLRPLTCSDLNKWQINGWEYEYPLDNLYKITSNNKKI